MKVGELIRYLRINKNILSQNLYKNILTRPAIVKFEKGESSTSTDKFLEILDRLNVTLEEFYYLYSLKNKYENPYIFTNKYINAFYKSDTKKMKELSILSANKYEESGIEKYNHYKAITNLLLYILEKKNTLDLEHEDFIIIKDYLINCNSWGYYEIMLFVNSLSFFSNDLIDVTYKKTKGNLLEYNQLVRYKNEMSILILNILNKKVRLGNIQSAKYFYKELSDLKEHTLDDMYLQSMLKYFGAIISYMEGDISSEEEIRQVINIFTFLNMDKKSVQCRELFEELKIQI